MQNFLQFLTLLLAPLVISVFSLHGEPSWTYELDGIFLENQTPDIITFELHKTRISRGVYAISGRVEIKQDLTNDLLIEATVYLSRTGRSDDYVKSPFNMPKTKLSPFANKQYKSYLMKDIANCTENSPQFETTMDMPLSKRNITVTNCYLTTEPYPSHLIPGYYRIIVRYSNEAEGWISFNVHVEPNY